jgi:hypothetical protein
MDALVYEKDGLKLYKMEESLDFSEQNENIETKAEYVVRGAEEEILVVFEYSEEAIFYLAMSVGDTGLYVNLTDESLRTRINEMLVDYFS